MQQRTQSECWTCSPRYLNMAFPSEAMHAAHIKNNVQPQCILIGQQTQKCRCDSGSYPVLAAVGEAVVGARIGWRGLLRSKIVEISGVRGRAYHPPFIWNVVTARSR